MEIFDVNLQYFPPTWRSPYVFDSGSQFHSPSERVVTRKRETHFSVRLNEWDKILKRMKKFFLDYPCQFEYIQFVNTIKWD